MEAADERDQSGQQHGDAGNVQGGDYVEGDKVVNPEPEAAPGGSQQEEHSGETPEGE